MNGSRAKRLPPISEMLEMIKRPDAKKPRRAIDKIMLITLTAFFLAIIVLVEMKTGVRVYFLILWPLFLGSTNLFRV